MFSKKYLTQCIQQNHLRASIKQSFLQSQRFGIYASSKSLFKSMNTQESFANGTSSAYMEQMYEQYKSDPQSVSPSWRIYFSNIDGGHSVPFQEPPNLGQSVQMGQILAFLKQNIGSVTAPSGQSSDNFVAIHEAYKIKLLITAYMTHGHMMADIDPLELFETYKHLEAFSHKFKVPESSLKKLIDYKAYGFTEADLEREFYIDAPELAGLLRKKKHWKLRELITAYEKAYCGKIGVEYMHIPDREECNWIRDKFEGLQYQKIPAERKLLDYDRLIWATEFGNFLENKFNTMKRFGLEGCESFIPGMKTCMDTLKDNGCEKVIMGMPHRGRLNVLANIVRKPLEQIFSEFQGNQPSSEQLKDSTITGDVKYHLGTSFEKTYPDGKKLMITVLANPSHLETVDPVVLGRARAEQHYLGDKQQTRICPVLIHGDAAFAGQGVVYESIQMTDLQNYGVGGTIHVIVNNQIGFTTTPHSSRSGVYCCELAKAINAPIFHVNADSMDDVSKVFEIAAEYRQKFHNDVIVDLIGYRKYGHNELDQPMFTQPLMYQKISQMQHVSKKYEAQLVREGVLNDDRIAQIKNKIKTALDKAYNESKTHYFAIENWSTKEWEELKVSKRFGKIKDTGVDLETLRDIGEKITTLPDDWEFHPQVKKIYEARRKSIKEGKGIDWGTAEALAFATLMDEGFHVRLSGQDVERGTFSHRHAVIIHQKTEKHYTPINAVRPSQEIKQFQVCNSHLSEYAVCGFELGYSQANPNSLVLWEAQFGDFANGAQIIIDTMLCCGEQKWNLKNGLVLLLPHGYDGQGPEHSSCRIERYLQLCDEDDAIQECNDPHKGRIKRVNWQVVNATTAAQYFHLLRRQLRRDFRKPLIVVAPKKLLKFKDACSNIEDFREGLRFRRVLTDTNKNLVAPEKVKKIIFCSGQVYYDLENQRQKEGKNDIAILRIEQLCPFPFGSIQPEIEKYKNASVMWVQEEPKNQGPYYFVEPRLRNMLKNAGRKAEVDYAGRAASAATSTGYYKIHEKELHSFLNLAMS